LNAAEDFKMETRTKKITEEELNEIGWPDHYLRDNGTFPALSLFGSWLRRNDPIAFEVYHNDKKREEGTF
jgi:hypothetical protein